MLDMLLINATVISKDGRYKANVGVLNGKTAMIMDEGVTAEARETIDLSGKYLLPGAIDAHVHFEDPGHTNREDFDHGTGACAVGGVTTCVLMPIHVPIILDMESLEASMSCYKDRGYVDYAVHGGLDATSLHKMKDLWEQSGIASIKVFMCQSSPLMGYVDDGILYEALQQVASLGALMTIHAENDAIIKLMERKAHDAARHDAMSFNESRPAIGEVEAVRRALFFAKHTGASIVFPHISVAESLIEIRKAKDEGVKAYAESCAQYFTFTTEDLKRQGPYLKFSPTMHDQENMEKLWDLIGKGYVDTIGSDHSPYELSEKTPGEKNIWDAPNGISGIEVELGCFLNGVSQGRLTLERLVEMTSYNPSKIYSLPGKGQIQVGFDADYVVIDMDKKKVFGKEDMQTKNKWSPFLGREFRGWPVMTFVRGVKVAENGSLTVEKGHAKYIARQK